MREEMTFKDLLGNICKNWRMLLSITLLMGLVLGGGRMYSLWDSLDDSDTAQTAYEAEHLTYQTPKEEVEYELF